MQPGPAPRFALCFSCLHQPLHSLVPLLMRIKAVGSGWHHAWHRAGLIEHLPDASAALCDLRPRQAAEGRCHRRRTRLEVCWLPGPRAALRAAQAPPSPRTFVLLILCQALHAGHEDVIIAQELGQQQAAETVTKALVPRGICGQDRDSDVSPGTQNSTAQQSCD